MLVTYVIIGFLTLALLSQYSTHEFVYAQTEERCNAEECHVTITKDGFEPRTMIVKIGTTVVWTNNDESRHTVSSRSPGEITEPLKSDLLETGDTYEFTFHHGGLYEGNYKYFDQVTSTMRGEIIVELEPEVEEVEEDEKVEYLLKRCRELRIQGNYEDALFHCNEVLRLEPNNIEALNSTGIALILLKKYNLSIMAFDKILELEPDNAHALAGKGYSLIVLGKSEEATTYITTALELEPKNGFALVAHALFLEKQGKLERAMIEIDKVLKILPERPFVLLRKAELLVKLANYDQDNYKQALSYYDQVLASEPNNVKAIVGRGNIFSEQGKYDMALLAYDQALKLQPDNDDAYLGRGTVDLKLELYNEAIMNFDMVLKNNRENVLVLNKKGEALMKLGKYKEAITEFETALQFDPANLIILTNKGDAASDLGKYRQAIRAYDRALKIDPDHVDAILGKGLALVKVERYKESLTYFDDILEYESENIENTEGKWYAESELGNEAIKGKTEALTGLGNMLLLDGSWEEAKSEFDKALALNSEHGEAIKGKVVAKSEIASATLFGYFRWLGIIGTAIGLGTLALAKLRKKEKTK